MNALLLVTLVCFFALFVAALAIARHIRMEAVKLARAARDLQERARPSGTGGGHAFAPPRSTEQRLRNVAERKQPDWRFLVSEERRRSGGRDGVSATLRKGPASAGSEARHRADWTYFNKDLGDLSDPYEPNAPEVVRRSANSGRR